MDINPDIRDPKSYKYLSEDDLKFLGANSYDEFLNDKNQRAPTAMNQVYLK